ncbi:hypothetical protein [Terrabacter sp. NPDC000476]|uniref:hypothetical protein n=1 Tax=Terrabacter sp. NPDC000476 TaxID=3154258 RepID=UPI00332B0DE7
MAKQPDPWRTLAGEIQALRRELAEVKRRSPYAGAGMAPNGNNGVQVDGDLIVSGNFKLDGQGDVDGSLDVGGSLRLDGTGTVGGTWKSSQFDGNLGTGAPGTTGWAFDDSRAILPELVLRPGSIGNDSLTEPVRAARLHDDAKGFGVGTAFATILTATITVPAGYTQALIMSACVGATAYNNTTAVDFLYTRLVVSPGGLLAGWAIGSVDVDASGTGVSYDFRSGLLTGLTPGTTLTFTGQVSSAFGAWAGASYNVANLDAAILWLR